MYALTPNTHNNVPNTHKPYAAKHHKGSKNILQPPQLLNNQMSGAFVKGLAELTLTVS